MRLDVRHGRWTSRRALTEPDTLTININIDTEEGRQACREQEVETGDPATDDSTFLETLLSKLTS